MISDMATQALTFTNHRGGSTPPLEKAATLPLLTLLSSPIVSLTLRLN